MNVKGPSRHVFWTGKRMIVADRSFGHKDNAIYDPCNDTWERMSTPVLPPGLGHAKLSQWVGDRIVLWLRPNYPKKHQWSVQEYDPDTNEWSDSAIPPATPPVDVVGTRLLMWNGKAGDVDFATGRVHDLAQGRTIDLPKEGAPSARQGAVTAVLDDHRYLVWGGWGRPPNNKYLGDGAILDVREGAWTPVPEKDAPSPRSWAFSTWAGKKLIVWGDIYGQHEGGSIYDPVKNRWKAISEDGAPSARQQSLVASASGRLIVAGGYNVEVHGTSSTIVYVMEGALYNLDDDRWTAFPVPQKMDLTWSAVHALTDGRFLFRHRDLTWMMLFDPVSLQWIEIDPGSVASRGEARIVWTGSRLIVWGGLHAKQVIPNPCANVPPGFGCDPPGPSITYMSDGAMYFFGPGVPARGL